MTPFEYLAGTMMLIVGLGITRLLSGLVDRFRDRHLSKPHWIPLVWALLVFVFQMQFLWAAFELNTLIEIWTVSAFIFMLVYALGLFLAGVLVIPRSRADKEEDAFEFFLRDGRWALMALAFIQLWSLLLNPVLFNVHFLDLWNLFGLLGIAILLITFFSKSRQVWAIGTILYLVYDVVIILKITPGQYQ